MVQQETGEQQAEEHDQATNQVGDATITEHNTDKQADVGSRKVEQNQNQHKSKEFRPCGDQPGHGVDNDAHDNRREEPQGHNVENDLGREVSDWMVVAICSFPNKQEPFSGEHRETCQSAESEQSKNEEEETKTVLETLDIVGQPVEEEPRKHSQEDRDCIVGKHQHRITIEIAPRAL